MNWRRISDRASTLPPMLFDASLALVLGLVGAAQLVSDRLPFEMRGPFRGPGGDPITNPGGGNVPPPGSGFRPPPSDDASALSYVLLGLCAASLVVRRRYPLASLAGVTAFGSAYLLQDQPAFTVQLIVLVAIYSAVADSSLSRPQAIVVAIGAAAVLGLALLISDVPRRDSVWAMDGAWVLAAIFLGDSVRSRRAYTLAAERVRYEEAHRRIADERLQIARELHDVVGHNISLINVQAGAGEHVLYKEPEQSQQTFANIRQASHETLQELRSMVGVLRESTDGQTKAPVVGLDALDQLVKSVIDAGQSVELTITGEKKRLAGVVDLSAYRILQEALTNTVRHAPRSKVRVRVDFRDSQVSLEVVNDRGSETDAQDPGGGHGIVGMRERVAAIGGKLDAGPLPNGGFQVRAVLPLTGAAS